MASTWGDSWGTSWGTSWDVAVVTELSGLDVYYGGNKVSLALVSEAQATTGMGGKLKMRIDGVTYGVRLVETTDANASRVRVRTATGIKAIKVKTT